MYEIAVEKHFDAAHYLRGYQGKCEAMHGHRYKVVVRIKAAKLNAIGLAYDFSDLKRHLKDILARYDHTCLNEVPPFDKINPSAENIASAIYKELKEKLAADPSYARASEGRPVTLTAVEAWESPEQGVTYRPD
jgi:6-pyruvoyltetrahydropterin/6-carboxytetrahydropterin synthase